MGGGGVGKSALTLRLITNNFDEEYDPTIEDLYRMVFYIDNQSTTVDILDTAGQDEFSSMQDQWVREGDGFLLVYSITSSATFNEVKQLYEKIKRTKPGKVPMYVSMSYIIINIHISDHILLLSSNTHHTPVYLPCLVSSLVTSVT